MVRKNLYHQIPKEWKYDFLDKFTDRRSGHTPSQSFPEYWNGGVKWISLADSYRLDKGFITESDKKISEKGLQNSSAELHPENTVVMTRDAGIGKSGILASEMAVSQHFIAWRCDNETTINSWFLYNWLQFYKSEFERQAVGSTIKTLGLPYFKKLKIALPPFSEQQKIAAILSTWDKAIEVTKKLISNSQAQKRALMQQLLTGKKRLLDENGERFSGKWEKVLLKNLCSIQTGKKDANEGTEKGKYPFFTCAKNHIYTDNHSFDCEAILIAGNGAIGTTHYYNGKFEVYQRTYVLSDFNTVIKPLFLLYFINYWLHIDIKREQQRGAMPYIRVGLLQNFKVSLPSILEQEKIISALSCINQEVKNLENKLEYLKQEKKALMQQLLTGKRRVKTDN